MQRGKWGKTKITAKGAKIYFSSLIYLFEDNFNSFVCPDPKFNRIHYRTNKTLNCEDIAPQRRFGLSWDALQCQAKRYLVHGISKLVCLLKKTRQPLIKAPNLGACCLWYQVNNFKILRNSRRENSERELEERTRREKIEQKKINIEISSYPGRCLPAQAKSNHSSDEASLWVRTASNYKQKYEYKLSEFQEELPLEVCDLDVLRL